MIPSSVREVFIPVRDEAELASAPAEYVSVVDKPHGDLLVTNYRVALLCGRLGSIRMGGEEYPVREARVNIGYASFISASRRVERRLLLRYEVVEVSYEAAAGIARKAVFRLRQRGVAGDLVDAMSAAAAKFREKAASSPRPPYAEFMGLIEFLSVDKSIRPLYYDSVSRCVVIGSSYFCVTSPDWEVEGSRDIAAKARIWVDEYRSKLRPGS